MTNEATNQAETLRREVAAPNNARAGADFLTGYPARDVLPAFFSVITSDSPLPEKLNAIKNVKAALDKPEDSGLRERITGSPESFLDGAILGTKEVWMSPSPQALSALETIRGNFQRGLSGSRTQTLDGSNYEILTFGVDSKTLTQAVMAGVFNKDEPAQFREALFKTFLTWSSKPAFQKHYFGPNTAYGEIDFSRERDRRAEEGPAERAGRVAGRAWRKKRELPGEALGKVRTQLLKEQEWEQRIINRGKEMILTPPRRARTLLGRGATFLRSAPGRALHGTGEFIGPRVRGARDGTGRALHGLVEVPGRVGNSIFGRFRGNPNQPPQQPVVPEQPMEGDFHEIVDGPALEPGQATANEGRTRSEAEERNIAALRERFGQARARTPQGEFHIPDEIPTEWNRVLDVISGAIPQRVETHYRQELEKYDPVRILSAFEEQGLSRDSEEYRALEELLRNRTAAIEAAHEEALRIQEERRRRREAIAVQAEEPAPPPTVDISAVPEVSKTIKVGFAEDPNTKHRDSMEDTHTIAENFGGKPNQVFYGIYDGHGGKETADFVSRKLHENILAQLNSGLEPKEALRRAYLAIDSEALELSGNSGSTAVSALVIGDRLYIANIGDARAVLSRKGKAVRLSKDHKAGDPQEKKRVEKAGGKITTSDIPRVEGRLALARSFGDKSLKKYVIADPYVTETTLTPQDDFLILACDGVWDVLKDQEAVDLIKNEEDPQKAADMIKNAALQKGSTDNISVMVV